MLHLLTFGTMSTSQSVTLDHAFYPVIIDLIFANASYRSLLSLRTACKQFRDRVDRQILRHVVVNGELEAVGLVNGEDFAILMGDGRRIPRTDWRETELARHVKRMDVEYLCYYQADLINSIGPVDILRDVTSDVWTRPAAKVHIMVNPEQRICGLTGPSQAHVILVLDQVRDHQIWNPFPRFHPAEFTVVLLPPNKSENVYSGVGDRSREFWG